MSRDKIRMRISKETHCHCDSCGKPYNKEYKEFYDIMIGEHLVHLCYDCTDVLFHKTLKAQCNYNHKVKNPKKLALATRWDEMQQKQRELDKRWEGVE